MEAAKLIRRRWALGSGYWHSLRAARRADFRQVEALCLFAGYPRSGHSLVGALLDAHPEALIAHEQHVLRYVKYGFRREQIFALLAENSARQAENGREVTGYRYAVPGQWQGRAETLRVIGDKRGGGTVRKLRARPWLLERLERRMRLPIRWLHVIRNPWDNIATIHRRSPNRTLEQAADYYFGMVEGVAWLKALLPAEALCDVHHRDLIADPKRELERLRDFLGLSPDAAWLDAAAAIVWDAPHRSRHEVAWPDALHEAVAKRAAAVAFLSDYEF
ncbi:MAG: sulfotransferase [Myxococcales bacterium]|nr:sulfotransferase [Myxococcales bacterium]